MTDEDRQRLDVLGQRLTDARRERLQAVLSERTRAVTLVLEGMRQAHNASAVLRSCDVYGIQDVHIVDVDEQFEIKRDIALGTNKWLTLHYHESLADCVQSLREAGYRLVASSPHPPATPLSRLDLSQPVALLLGSELYGLSPAAEAAADERVTIPMRGFAESLNVSVAAAVMLHDLRGRLREQTLAGGPDWRLPADERSELFLRWTRASIPDCDAFETELERRGELPPRAGGLDTPS